MTEKEKDTETLSTEEENEEVLDLPDDEFLNQGGGLSEETEETSEEETDEGEENDQTDEETEETTETEEGKTKEDGESTEEESEEDDRDSTESDEDTETEESDDTSESDKDVDYSAFYSKVMKPFKANGKMITPESEEDVVSLMQMGANYVKKMETIKPALKVLSSLEKNEIDNDELNHLIDLKNKNPEAIKKFLKDAEIDPSELDLEEESNYKPSNNLVSDEEAVFNDTVKEIQDSPYFDETKKIVTETWDKESRERLLKNPELLKKLNEELELERFDKVQSIVDRERIFGRLKDVNDLDAYIMTVSKLTQEEQPNDSKQTDTKSPSKTEKKVTQVNKTGNKKGAKPTPTKSKAKSVKYTDDEILNMSDEAFLKVADKQLY